MNKSSTFGCLWIVLVSIAVMGCVGAPGAPDEDIASAQEASLTTNSLTTNSLTTNSLTTNSLTTNSLTTNSLTTNSLTTNSLTTNALTDPNAQEVLEYIVSCALPPEESVSVTVDGETYTYQGGLGLAPEWGEPNGQCDETCQEWVSGCLIARLDYLGVERPISVRGANPGLATTLTEQAEYPAFEATYFGNVFVSPQQIYGCMFPVQRKDPRVCGPSIADCVVTFPGSCNVLCDPELPDFSNPNCSAEPGGTPYVGSVTVFLPLSGD
jgi:GLTT repeat (6 copies)